MMIGILTLILLCLFEWGIVHYLHNQNKQEPQTYYETIFYDFHEE
ncbi:hypothetical protein [Pontibacillus sp. ALD_SL1]|nr:hypothetical protein [Pontibacillus sp. ALD_SL1]